MIFIISVVTVPGSCNLVGGGGFLDPPPRWQWFTVFSADCVKDEQRPTSSKLQIII